MPVVVDFSPVGAIGNAASRVFAQQNGGGRATQYVPGTEINAESLPGDVNDMGGGQSALIGENGMPVKLLKTGSGSQPQAEYVDNATNTTQVGPNGQTVDETTGKPGKVRYDDGSGNVVAVTPDQKTKLDEISNDDSMDDDQKQYAKHQVLGIANTTTRQLADGTTVQVTGAQASTADQKDASSQMRKSEFDQRMTQRQQQIDAQGKQATDKLATMTDLAEKRLAATTDTNEARQIHEQTQLMVQGHTGLINQAKTHLQTARQGLSEVMTNTPFDQAKVQAAQQKVEEATNEYDGAMGDFQKDLDNHISKLGQGTAASPGVSPDKPGIAVAHAVQMGATNIADDTSATAYLKAAGAGQVATQADVTSAMQAAGGDKEKAKAILKTKGFAFTRTGTAL